MRRLVWAIAIAALVGTGWWGVAMWSLSSGLQGWLAERRMEGWQAEVTEITRGGFPFEVHARLENLALADPDTGVALQASALTLAARTLWPGDVRLTLPQTPLQFSTPTRAVSLGFDTGQADLNLAPGTPLDLINLSFTSGPVQARAPKGGVMTASQVELRMARTDAPATYDMTLALGQFAPGEVTRQAFMIPDSWPLIFTELQSRATVTFDRPWNRRAIEEARPQPRQITLHQAEAHWGDVRVRVAGALDVDPQGVPTGDIVIRAQNWQAMLDVAEQSGLLESGIRDTVQNVLTSLAAGSGRTNDLDVTLTFDRGLIRVGFLPLGPAPRLILR